MPVEDRLLFRFNTSDRAEFGLILTRAMSIRLLAQMEAIIKLNLEREYPVIVEDSLRAVGEFKRDAAIGNADYRTPYSTAAATYPIGTQALLVTGLERGMADGIPTLGFKLSSNQTLNLSLDHDLAQAINKLFRYNVAGLDWGIFAVDQAGAAAAGGDTRKAVVH